MNNPSVSVVVLNYNGKYFLNRCISSVKNQTHPPSEIIVVDNASTDGSDEAIKKSFPEIKLIKNKKNLGFARGNNMGIAAAKGDYVFLLNNDAETDPRCIEEMLKIIEKEEKIVCVAPKMLFFFSRRFIDNVGSLITKHCMGVNKGVGQLDIGQFDASEQTFGASFGATLIKKWAFSNEHVGKLDESYFMYYEDIDWCLRANILGYKCYTAPKAVVYHIHSASTKEKSFSKKVFYLQRNWARTAIKNLETKRAIKAFIVEMIRQAYYCLVKREFITARILAVLQALLGLPRTLFKRYRIQKGRKTADKEIIKYSIGQTGYFDPVDYTPEYELDCLVNIYKHLYMITKKEEVFRIYERIAAIALLSNSIISGGRINYSTLAGLLIEALEEQPDFVQEYARNIDLEKPLPI